MHPTMLLIATAFFVVAPITAQDYFLVKRDIAATKWSVYTYPGGSFSRSEFQVSLGQTTHHPYTAGLPL
jgi:hypothetical protein